MENEKKESLKDSIHNQITEKINHYYDINYKTNDNKLHSQLEELAKIENARYLKN